MTSHPSHRPVSALRARMIEDMRVRGFTEKTRSDYVRNVRAFAAFIGRSPDTATQRICGAFSCTRTGWCAASKASTVRGCRAFLLRRDARPAGPCVAAHGRTRTTPVAGYRASRRSRCCSRQRRGRSARRNSPSPRVPGCAFPRSSRSRSARSTPSACSCGSNRVSAAKTATPCCRRRCSSCCAPGGGGRHLGLLLPGASLFPGRNPLEPL